MLSNPLLTNSMLLRSPCFGCILLCYYKVPKFWPIKDLLYTLNRENAWSPLSGRDFRDSMPNRNARLFDLLLRQAYRDTDLQSRDCRIDIRLCAGWAGRETLDARDQNVLCETLIDNVLQYLLLILNI